MLTALDISCAPDTYKRLVASVAGPSAGSMTKDQTLAVVGMLTADPAQQLAGGPSGLSRVDSASGLGTPTGAGGGGGSFAALEREASTSSPAKPFRRLITKNRAYLETGSLHVDEAVVAYMAKLEEHRRRCEAEGRYQEAKVATKRLADLRTAQVEKLRQELAANQTRELEEVQGVYEEETAKFHHIWDGRMRDYATSLAKATEDLKAAHTAQLAAFVEELQKKRPTRARPSRDYLLQREMQDKLAKSQQYSRATKVKSMADELYQAELETTVAAWEAESKLKIAKLQAKQQTEFEALLQRGTKGRDELELKRVAETERRTLRFRNIVSELEQLHKLEMAHLENFLDGQVLAGKATPLRDPGAFRRKREQLFSLAI
ncbi:hypothetical protein HXX76_005439 [Chlamydomonas incerta]|uniref:Uncharacterized protein n=1 Tax=Chlamydomonas incerta TaxID=51695 RepID=A0A835W5F6_CHLIN|nr:hypothetical protein HXX76_005439 [Chlamydomonas incerta]|eukprot:KAG2437819.1 hypothetical protein HXX76_005439 [Chlamydomonas incerta]